MAHAQLNIAELSKRGVSTTCQSQQEALRVHVTLGKTKPLVAGGQYQAGRAWQLAVERAGMEVQISNSNVWALGWEKRDGVTPAGSGAGSGGV